MDAETRAAFREHVESLTERGVAGDLDAIRSLACMALLIENDFTPNPDGDGEPVVVYFEQWRNVA